MSKEKIYIFDTTLRDGAQTEGVNFSIDDKNKIAKALSDLGVDYLEGGWPGANTLDTTFFNKPPKLGNTVLTAFGMTKRSGRSAQNDPGLSAVLNSNTPAVCLVGKSWDFHVDVALGITNKENLENIKESAKLFIKKKKEFMFDAEHFFDGYKNNPEFSLRVLEAASIAGAERLILCDTNGGSLPQDVSEAVASVASHLDTGIGVHLHNDTGCGVANALAGVMAGAIQVQGTINGYGERTGNCDLVSIIANLSLKMGIETIPSQNLELLTPVSHHVAELVNITLNPQQPYTGASAFAHKAGLHVSAISKRPDAYEHVSPESIGNGTRFLVSEMAGRSTLELKAKEIGINLDGKIIGDVVEALKRLEYEGYHFEVADASLELLMRGASGWTQDFFNLKRFSVDMNHRGSGSRAWNEISVEVDTRAVVDLEVNGKELVGVGDGNGPVNAIDTALRSVLIDTYPQLEQISLVDYKVRVLDTDKGTGAVTRVLLDSTNGEETWTTIGVSENIIEASWQALVDSIVYGLLHARPSTK